ncbi:MAG: hypothetical protein M1482_13735 [Chloroflexi bacterium]|nr:hypothetical protein [Chloroflexota bacterium]
MQTYWPRINAAISQNRGRLAIVGALVALTIGVRLWVGELLVDDSYITFRYAENIAAGRGFVYNVGERVLGTSTPAFTLLLALLDRIGIPPAHASYGIAAASDAILIIALVVLVSRLQGLKTGLWVAAWAAVSPALVVAAASGMETEFYTAMIACSFALFAADRRGSSVFVAAVIALTRPEGFLVLGSLLVVSIVRREFDWRAWVPGGAILSLWAIFSLAYFGSLVPNSVPAKLALHPPYSDPWHNALQVVLTFSQPLLFDYHTVLALAGSGDNTSGALAVWPAIPMTLLMLAGIVRLRTTRLAPVGVWLIAVVALFAIPNRYMFPWYGVPMLPFAFVLASVGALVVYSCVPGRWRQAVRTSAIGIAALTTTLLLIGASLSAHSTQNDLARREAMYACVGRMLDGVASPHLVVAAPEIGALGYEYHGYVLDLDGLVSPAVLRYYQPTTPAYHDSLVTPLDAVRETNPDAVVFFDSEFSGSDAPWFLQHYRRLAYFPQLHPYYGSLEVYARSDMSLALDTSMCPAPGFGE